MYRIRCAKLFEAAKIHVKIMRFTCCLNMAFNLIRHKMDPDLFGMTIHMKPMWPSLIISAMLLFAKRCACLWHCDNVMTFESLTLTPLF